MCVFVDKMIVEGAIPNVKNIFMDIDFIFLISS